MTDQPTRTCKRCNEMKGIIEFDARRTTCRQCYQVAAAKRQERKERIEYSEAIHERIVDGVASGLTFAEICVPAGMPTVQQLIAWRRRHPELADAMDEARTHRATIRSDRIDETLADLRMQKISAAEARTIIDAEMKLMALEDPARFNPATKVQQEISGPNGAPLQVAESPFETARWLASLLHGTVRAAALPMTGTTPEQVAATRVEVEKLLGRPVTDGELQEALADPRWSEVTQRALDAIEGREPRPLPPPAPSRPAAPAQPVEDATIIDHDTDPWRTGIARFDPASGRLVSETDARVVSLAASRGKTVVLPDGNRTTFVSGEDDGVIEERLAAWYRDRAGVEAQG
jgi:hypothetical protein